MNNQLDYRKKAIELAKNSCDTMMRKFKPEELPPVHKFHYHQGVFLSGMMKTYEVCCEEKYIDYIKAWVDSIIWEDGSIHDFDPGMLDDIQPGILLFKLYERSGDKRYKTALETLMPILKNWKKNEYGGFWHKEWHPNQMWLDGLYMAGPLEAEYAAKFNSSEFLETAIDQIFIMEEHIKDPQSGLLRHAWDSSKEEAWSDPETGLSPEVWGRAMGWYVVAVLDILEHTPTDNPRYDDIVKLENKMLKAVIKYQDSSSGMWYQLPVKGDCEGNWLETSCTSLFAYAIAKAIRMGVLEHEYKENAVKALYGAEKHSIEYDSDNLLIKRVCVGTGVGDYDFYIKRPTSINDLHGAGAFLLMCSELSRK